MGGDRGASTAAAREVPWWGAVSAAAAPLLLVTGITAAAALQPPGFAAFSGTVSSLAGQGADYTWVMTLTFAVVGGLEMVTALALRPAARAGRLVLAGAGFAGMLVAAFPAHLGGSRVHALWAGIGFAGLILWPLLAMRRVSSGGDGGDGGDGGYGGDGRDGGYGRGTAGQDDPAVPWALRPATCVRATAGLSLLTIWFAAEQATSGQAMGLAERTAGLAQTLWPLFVVMSCRHAQTGEDSLGKELPDTRPGSA